MEKKKEKKIAGGIELKSYLGKKIPIRRLPKQYTGVLSEKEIILPTIVLCDPD